MASSPLYARRLSDKLTHEYAQHRDTMQWWTREVVNGHPRNWCLAGPGLGFALSPSGDVLTVTYGKFEDGSPNVGAASKLTRAYARLPRGGNAGTL